jgi:hypothetical protein
MKHSKTGRESGASDVPFITPVAGEYLCPFGITPQETLTRHRKINDGIADDAPTPIMKRGNYFQAGALKWFNDEFETKIAEPASGYKNAICNLVSSLDGIYMEDWEMAGHRIPAGSVWECKLPRQPAPQVDTLERVLQVQAQLDCANAEIGIIAELAQSDCRWRLAVVQRHEPTIEAIRAAVDVFWQHMKDDTDYLPATSKEANRLINGNRRPEVMDLTNGPTPEIMGEARQHLIEAADTWLACKRTMKATEQMIEKTELTMKHSMGGVERVALPGDREIRFTTVEYKAQPEKTRVTAAKEAHTSRRFAIKELDA